MTGRKEAIGTAGANAWTTFWRGMTSMGKQRVSCKVQHQCVGVGVLHPASDDHRCAEQIICSPFSNVPRGSRPKPAGKHKKRDHAAIYNVHASSSYEITEAIDGIAGILYIKRV